MICAQHLVDIKLLINKSQRPLQSLSLSEQRADPSAVSTNIHLLTVYYVPGADLVLYDLILSAAHKMPIASTPVVQMRKLRL